MLNLPHFTSTLGEVHAVLGESGSGKSLLLKCLIGLLPDELTAKGRVQIEFEQNDLNLDDHWSRKNWQQIRGKHIGMVFQEPLSALNPQMTCGAQLKEAWEIHAEQKDKKSESEIRERLTDVGLGEDIERIMQSYPHQLSGGQRQRVVIAMATTAQTSDYLGRRTHYRIWIFSLRKKSPNRSSKRSSKIQRHPYLGYPRTRCGG